MTVKAIVLYANDTDTSFDMNYYLTSHMPLVQRVWNKHGLKSWDVIHFGEGPSQERPSFVVQATLTFSDGPALQSALADTETAIIFGDVPKFTNKEPIFIAGPVVGSSA